MPDLSWIGMRVIAYDMYPNKELEFVEYMSLADVLKQSDLIPCIARSQTRLIT